MARNIKALKTGFNYELTQGRPWSSRNKAYNHGDRIAMVGQILAGTYTIAEAADEMGVVKQTIKNWLATADKDNPRLMG
jgi:transposase-like protein